MTTADRPVFDPTTIPLSRRGSWLTISSATGPHHRAGDLHLVSNITEPRAVLTLVPRFRGARVRTTWQGRPGVLRWTSPHGGVRAAFESDDTVRVRGGGLGMTFAAADGVLAPCTGLDVTLDPVDGAAVFTVYETGRRYRISLLAGSWTVAGLGEAGEIERAVTAEPGPEGTWEVAIQELETGDAPYARMASFDDVVADADRDFAEFLDDVADWRSPETPAAALATYVVWSATVTPAGFVQRDAVLSPANGTTSVSSWDHCVHALATVGVPSLAWDQLQLPFDYQDGAGALPESVTRSQVVHRVDQPPIHGWTYQELLAAGLPRPTEHERQEWYDRLVAWTRFWLDHRRASGHALPHHRPGNDRGWHAPTSPAVPAMVQTADLAAFLALQVSTLADLAAELGRDRESRHWREQGTDLVEQMLTELWDGQQFVACDVHTGAVRAHRSLLGVLPLLLGTRLPPQVTDRLRGLTEGHLLDRGPVAEPLESPGDDDDDACSDSMRAPTTLLVERGLRRAGSPGTADAVGEQFRRRYEAACSERDPDAVPRDRADTSTAAVYLVLAREHLARRAAVRPGAGRRGR